MSRERCGAAVETPAMTDVYVIFPSYSVSLLTDCPNIPRYRYGKYAIKKCVVK